LLQAAFIAAWHAGNPVALFLEDTSVKKLSTWTKPMIEVTSINLAKYYAVNNGDEGGAEHRS
jgi:hypothetical protein